MHQLMQRLGPFPLFFKKKLEKSAYRFRCGQALVGTSSKKLVLIFFFSLWILSLLVAQSLSYPY
jgi:hypothetical protein